MTTPRDIGGANPLASKPATATMGLMKRSKELNLWTVLIAAVFVTALSASNVLFFSRQAQKSRKINTRLGQMEGYINRLNTLEWQAMAKEKLDQGARESFPNIRRAMEAIFKTIADYDGEGQPFQKIKHTYGMYSEAIEAEFELLAGG